MLREAAALVYVVDLERPELTATDAHHLLGPLRLRPGELVVGRRRQGGLPRLPAGGRSCPPGRPLFEAAGGWPAEAGTGGQRAAADPASREDSGCPSSR